jgi:DNA replication and repair protein RecF
MKINKLYLRNFRNHENLVINFDSNLTYVYGNNGQGKTNILEAIYFLSTTKSLKATVDKELINYLNNFLIIQAKVLDEDEEINLEISLDCIHSSNNRSIKKVKMNQVPKSITNFAGKLKSVLFTPQDIEIMLSSSSVRRRYLDTIFYQISDEYKSAIINYTKALKQRNKILEIYKEYRRGLDQLSIWTDILIKEGRLIQKYRQEFFNFYQENINSLYEKLNLREIEVNIEYKKNEASYENYEANKDKEIYTGNTSFGPHKDDFIIFLNSKDISKYGSRGQQRIAISILKFMELDFIFYKTKVKPILLLDDIFSELDDTHKKGILNLINEQQTIITGVYLTPEIQDLGFKLIDLEELKNQQNIK